MDDTAHPFDEAFGKAVDLGNQIADDDEKADLWDIADGLLAGAVQYWLYSRQPCGDPRCEECLPISTAEARISELRRLIELINHMKIFRYLREPVSPRMLLHYLGSAAKVAGEARHNRALLLQQRPEPMAATARTQTALQAREERFARMRHSLWQRFSGWLMA